MKIRYLSLIVLLVMSVFAPMQAQTYDNLWKELEVLERKDLPKSVISEAMKIYDKAKGHGQLQQFRCRCRNPRQNNHNFHDQ